MPPTAEALKTDWIFSFQSNLHVAKDKSWFIPGTLNTFKSMFTNAYSITEIRGFGDVQLPVQIQDPDGTVRDYSLYLQDVAYAPTYISNVLGYEALQQVYGTILDYGERGRGILVHREGSYCASLLEVKKTEDGGHVLWRMVITGQTPKEFSTNPAFQILARYIPSCAQNWAVEKARLQEVRAREMALMQNNYGNHTLGLPKLTLDEEDWLLEHYGHEEKFMRGWGLGVNDESHRIKGRAILRRIMDGEEVPQSRTLDEINAWIQRPPMFDRRLRQGQAQQPQVPAQQQG